MAKGSSKQFGSAAGSHAATTDLYAGLVTRNPKWPDKSVKYSGGSVNDDATRTSAAKTPKTLGPREA